MTRRPYHLVGNQLAAVTRRIDEGDPDPTLPDDQKHLRAELEKHPEHNVCYCDPAVLHTRGDKGCLHAHGVACEITVTGDELRAKLHRAGMLTSKQ